MTGGARDKLVVVIGAGGNIGSHLVPHLARTPGIRKVTLVDRDVYDETNLWSQDIRRRDVGRPKATVQARRLREIDGTLDVEAVTAPVEDVPLGMLRSDVLLACVDSRAARRSINARAWRLGVPWIDSGVNGEELLARVNVYVPGAGQPCLECAWSDGDYETLEQEYPCASQGVPAATNAPSALGALAAALQALECRALLAERWEDVVVGRQLTVSVVGHRALVTKFAANPRCRFDHAVWRIERIGRSPEACTVEEALEIGRRALAADGDVLLEVVGQVFARKLSCTACGNSREFMPHLLGRLGPIALACDACGGAMRAAGFDVLERLHAPELPPAIQRASLRSLGVRAGDVLRVSDPRGAAYFEIGGST